MGGQDEKHGKQGWFAFFLFPTQIALKEIGFKTVIPQIFVFYHMSLYRNIAISGSNVDIPTLEEISRFTHAPIYRCSPPKRYTQLTIIDKIDLKECHSLTV